jgi:hypothetical protein
MLTGRQKRLILHLVQCPTIRRACRKAGVPVRTYGRWKHQPAFAAALEELRREAFQEGVAQLKAALPKAAGTLVKHLRAERPADAIRSARAILDTAFRGVELMDLIRDVQELKRAHYGSGGTEAGGGGAAAAGNGADGPNDPGIAPP